MSDNRIPFSSSKQASRVHEVGPDAVERAVERDDRGAAAAASLTLILLGRRVQLRVLRRARHCLLLNTDTEERERQRGSTRSEEAVTKTFLGVRKSETKQSVKCKDGREAQMQAPGDGSKLVVGQLGRGYLTVLSVQPDAGGRARYLASLWLSESAGCSRFPSSLAPSSIISPPGLKQKRRQPPTCTHPTST